jgi:sugar-specific transcriptional regulator TrmB
VVSDSFEAFFEEVEAQINPQGDEEDAWRADMLRRLRALVEKERERYVALAKGRAEEFDELVARTKAALAAKSEELERERAPYAGSIQRRDETIDRLRAVMLECADKCSAEADIYSVWAEPIAARLREEAGR